MEWGLVMINKIERDKLRELASARKWHYQEESDAYTHIVRGPNEKYICGGPQTSKGDVEGDIRFIAGAPHAIIALLDHIDALERRVEGAFREGYNAGYSAGSSTILNIEADKNDCWNISNAKAAIASASEE